MPLVAVTIGVLHNSVGGANTHVRTCTCHFYISGTAAPIALKFGMQLVVVPLGCFHNSVEVPARTCARAHPIPLSQECLDRWDPNLMCDYKITNFDLNKSQKWVTHICTCSNKHFVHPRLVLAEHGALLVLLSLREKSKSWGE